MGPPSTVAQAMSARLTADFARRMGESATDTWHEIRDAAERALSTQTENAARKGDWLRAEYG